MAYTNVNGTNGNNFLNFVGVTGFYNQTLVNPYSGYVITITGTKNVNNGIYDGLNGTDTLNMTAIGDVLTLVDQDGVIMVKNVEQFNAGDDGDVIVLAHGSIAYGNTTIRGSNGDDLLWANNGNDTLTGGAGDDIMDGGGGDDLLAGGTDDDYISGGLGMDTLMGGAGNDTLVYSIDGIWSGGYTLASMGSSVPYAYLVQLDGKNRSHDTFNGDAADDFTVPTIGSDTLVLTAGDDALILSDIISPLSSIISPRIAYIETIEAGAGNDVIDLSGGAYIDVTINGGAGNDLLSSSNGNDTLNGGADNDILFGSTGSDMLNGGTGDDTYMFNVGDGNDTIVETAGLDYIAFGSGITFADLTLTVSGMDLLVGYGSSLITIDNHFATDGSGRVEGFAFFDGSMVAINIAPDAQNDTFNGSEDTAVSGNVLGNDTDPENSTLLVTAGIYATSMGGSVELLVDGSFTYTPAANFFGTDSFNYTITDSMGATDTATVTLNVASVNDAPVANDDSASGNEDTVIAGSVLGNDNDADGDTLMVDAAVLTTANGGSVVLNSDGTFTYQGAANFNGSDSFSYTVRDASGAMSTANVLVAVAAVNDAPVASDDSFAGYRNDAITGTVLANDSDIDGDTLSVTAGTFATAMGGSLVLAVDGSFTYTPADNFYGSDSFDYTLLDSMGGSDIGTLSFNVQLNPAESIIGTEDGEVITGTTGGDEIFGLGGNDILYGDDGILTGTTMDKAFADTIVMPTLKEGVNITNLRPKGDPALGINNGNLHVDHDATATVTFRKGYAGYDNSFGVFAIDADGTIVNASMEWKNVKTAGLDTAHTIDLPVGAEGGDFGFFIIGNGNNTNGGYSGLNVTADGVLSFVYNYGQVGQRAATINDPGNKVSLVYNDGVKIKVLQGDVYFTTDRGDSTAINEDGKTHVVSGLLDNNNVYLDPKAANVSSKPVSFTQNGITISATSGTLIGNGDRIGVKTTANTATTVGGAEAMMIGIAAGAQKVTISLSDIAGGNTGIDFKIYLNGSTTPISYEHVTGTVSGGLIDIVLNASDFGAGVITGIEVSSIANSAKGVETFYLDNIYAEIPGGTDTNTLRIGFEDLYNTGDADYEDVLFDLDINPVTIGDVTGGDDILDGGAGNDVLYGEGGNDILVMGLGGDHGYGGEGADVFALTAIDGLIDTIHDFGADDSINIADVLDSYDPLSDDIADFVRLVSVGSDSQLEIAANGDGVFAAAALIVGGTGGADIASMIANGQLVADQSAIA